MTIMESSLALVLFVIISSYCESRNLVKNRTQQFGLRSQKLRSNTISVPVWKSALDDDSDWSPGTRSYVLDETYLWPHAEVPYVIDQSIHGMLLWKVYEAINFLNIKTCVRWLPATENDYNYVLFKKGGLPCWSQVGCVGGQQEINLNDLCIVDTMHEMMHTMGFIHEHIRLDRDCYVTIREDMISSNFNYRYYTLLPTDQTWPYDYKSVMHYPSHFGPLPIIWGKGPFYYYSKVGPDDEILMTELDRWKVNTLYCGKPHYCSMYPKRCEDYENYEKTCKPSYFELTDQQGIVSDEE